MLRWHLLDQKPLFSRPKNTKIGKVLIRGFTKRRIHDPRAFALLEDQGLPDNTAIPIRAQGQALILTCYGSSQAWGFDKFAAFEGVERDFFDFDDADMIVTNPFNVRRISSNKR